METHGADAVADSRKMVLSPGRRRKLAYELVNTGTGPMETLVALPANGPDQTVMSCEATVTSADGNSDVAAQERIIQPDLEAAAVTLPPGATLRAKALVLPWTRALVENEPESAEASVPHQSPDVEASLPPHRRAHYLRATPLTPITSEIRDEAMAIAGRDRDVLVRARRLFDHLTGGLFAYESSPSDHGAEALRGSRQGDAGDFTWLFVAWCRALGIPARGVLGAWPTSEEQRVHTWAECHVEGLGWVPVDPGVATALRRKLDTFHHGVLEENVGEDADAHFGRLIGERIVFARDGATALPERFQRSISRLEPDPSPAADPASGLVIAGRPFRRGIDTLEGAVPFLQPDFVVLHESDAKVPGAEWGISLAGWRGSLDFTYRISVFTLLGLLAYYMAGAIFDFRIPNFVFYVFCGAAVLALGAGLVLRRKVSEDVGIIAPVAVGTLLKFAEPLRDHPIAGPVIVVILLLWEVFGP